MEGDGRSEELGEDWDFEEGVRKHTRSMLQYADFVLHDLSAAEDAVQEAFVIAWRRRATLREGNAFAPWLRRIVLRECLRWRRHPWLRVLTLTDQVVSGELRTDTGQRLDVGRAVARLSPHLRAVIFLHFFEDLTLRAVADELGIPEGTVKTRLSTALRRLEYALPEYSIGGERPTP